MAQEGIMEIWNELDEDGSGFLDQKEFLQFFNVLDSYENMVLAEFREKSTDRVRRNICNVVLCFVGFGCFFFSFQYIQTKQNLWLTLAIGSASVVLFGVLAVLLWPVSPGSGSEV